ncbi:Fidgetin-like protein 1 [Frankliniella fusca]|uniref:Fidgetin-like protein 1 n=1 Tax=Frankliniella fusca TaxID=407009 RepID=A0AAE1HMP7_9NEOP|nr:Fidgetin-like protein 1 [Frankliniella fusca]
MILPSLRPDLFKPGSLREPSNTILLFGPPGTGKTLLGKCCATTANATFFDIKASDLTSKWIGDGEKYVTTLFQLGEQYKPCILFFDEIDCLLTKRTAHEHEASRKIKTEFLSCLDGIKGRSRNVYVMGTTNRPFDLDHAVLRRFTTQIHVPLPNCDERKKLFKELFFNGKITVDLNDDELQTLAYSSAGYSPADISVVCKAAANMPITSLSLEEALAIDEDDVQPVTYKDVEVALKARKPTCPPEIVEEIERWVDNI